MNQKYIRSLVIVTAFLGLILAFGCSSSTWKDANKANTYKAYQNYIEAHPHGKHVAEAKSRADTLYWASVKGDTTEAAFKTYLQKFPEGQFRSQAKMEINKISRKHMATQGRVTGSGVIIRSDHTTQSKSVGVVAKKGTLVQILDEYSSGDSNEAILKQNLSVTVHHTRIHLEQGKAIHIVSDQGDSVRASFSTSQFGRAEAPISKNNVEAISDQKWYKIRTHDNLTGWIFGKFIKEL